MTRYLITGGAGNLATQLTHELACQQADITLLDIAEQPIAEPAAGSRYIQGDVTDEPAISSLIREYQPDIIIHLASLLSGSSEENRRLAWRVNMDGSFHLLELAVEHNVKQFFFPSSVAAFGGVLPNPVPEDQPQWPEGIYGVTKAAVERLGVYYHQRHGLDFRVLRVPVVISEHAPRGAASGYASQAFVQAYKNGRFVFVVRRTSRPALIYVKDVLRAILQLLAAPTDALSRRVYNIQAISPTATELATAIAARLPKAELSFEFDPEVADLIDSWPIEFDDASARRDWHWNPQYDLEKMTDDFIGHLRSQSGDAQPLSKTR